MNIKIGDLIEDCSLMPGVVMKVNGDDIEIRRVDIVMITSHVVR